MIRQRGGIWQLDVDLPVHGRVRESLKTRDESTALSRAAARVAELTGQAGAAPAGNPDAPQMTMSEARELAMRTKWAEAKDPDKDRLSRAAVSLIGEARSIYSLTNRDIKDMRTTLLAKGLANGTINRHVSAITGMLRIVEEEMDLQLPVPRVRPLKESEGRVRYLSETEIAQLYAAEHDFQWRVFWRFLVEAGPRLSDALRAEWNQFDWDQGLWWCSQSKTDDPFMIPLGREMVDGLELLRRQGNHRPFTWSKSAANQRIKRLRRKHFGPSWEDVSCHVMRHTCATYLLSKGVEIRTVQKWLGHKSIDTTLRYAKVIPKTMMDHRDRIYGSPKL